MTLISTLYIFAFSKNRPNPQTAGFVVLLHPRRQPWFAPSEHSTCSGHALWLEQILILANRPRSELRPPLLQQQISELELLWLDESAYSAISSFGSDVKCVRTQQGI